MLTLSSTVNDLYSVGPRYSYLLNKLGIYTVKDLLFYFPFRYEDRSTIEKITDLDPIKSATVEATVEKIKNIRTRGGKTITQAVVFDDSGKIEVIWFNQPFLTKTIKESSKVLLNGKLKSNRNKPQLYSPTYEVLKESPSIHFKGIIPIYSITKGLTDKWLRSRIKFLLTKTPNLFDEIDDNLPQGVRESYDLEDLKIAIKEVHFPTNFDALKKAKYRLAFEELFTIQLKVLREKQKRLGLKSPEIIKNKTLIEKFKKSLSFELTQDQIKSSEEILEDLSKKVPMNRLLEGDVGSGKTVVAAIAALATINNGFQVAILVPTSILAEQHHSIFKSLLEPFKITVAKVTGITKKSFSKVMKLSNLIIGTHALLFRNKELFNNLGLIIIDEQHRFGVEQRNTLSTTPLRIENGVKIFPHKLSMTATPIPRSIALTIFGNLDISIINQMPKGRIPTKTYLVPPEKRKSSYNWIKQKVKEGNQVFWICPLIDESEELTKRSQGKDIKAATIEFEKLKKIFPTLKIELLHGKIKPKEKDEIMAKMKDCKIDILVSTSVVEVGMDIPNANLIIIESAERFGLAQLHQLRGRVGRREKESWCLLFTSTRNEIEESAVETFETYEKAINRLKYFSSHNNGLEVAQYDLQIRGPGEVYGTRQSGIPNLKIADITDIELVKKTREAAEGVISKDEDK